MGRQALRGHLAPGTLGMAAKYLFPVSPCLKQDQVHDFENYPEIPKYYQAKSQVQRDNKSCKSPVSDS